MPQPGKVPLRQPTFTEGLIRSIIPLAVAIAVISIGGFLVYLFWFGTDWIVDKFF
jgi:hypothetical protein